MSEKKKKKTTQIINGVCIYFLSREYSGANQNYIILVSTSENHTYFNQRENTDRYIRHLKIDNNRNNVFLRQRNACYRCSMLFFWNSYNLFLCLPIVSKKGWSWKGGKRPVGYLNNWVCAAGLSEPLPHYSLFCGQI